MKRSKMQKPRIAFRSIRVTAAGDDVLDGLRSFQQLGRIIMADKTALAMGTALAGGAIAAALLETLFDKGILDLDESRDVLDRAMKTLGPVMQTDLGFQASSVIGALQRGKFSARR
jgi:hypothetical protein